MLYLNTKALKLTPDQYFFLAAIKNQDLEYIKANERQIKTLEEQSLIKYIKPKNKQQNPLELLRLSDKGIELLKEVVEAEVSPEDRVIRDWLCDFFQKAGKITGNKTRLARHIRDFRIGSGVEKNNLIRLCLKFIDDPENMEYNHSAEYMFYKPKTVFASKFILEDSRLYQYLLKHGEEIRKTFEKYE